MSVSLGEDFVVGQPILGTRFVFVRTLGSGSFGSAVLVHDKLLQGYVVLKLLREASSADVVARFLREGRFQWGLRHRAIVQVTDLQHLPDGRPFLVMEYVEGQNLREFIRDHGRLPMLQALMMAAELFDGLQIAHDAGIIHRDVKPSNILVSRDGLLKVVDFGIAKRNVSDGSGGAPLTAEHQQLGTPGYCAPEQIQNPRDVTTAADIFSAGCVLYKMLTGCEAFEGSTPLERLRAALLGAPPRLHQALSEATVTPALEALQARLFARDPAQRPKAADAAAELRKLAREFPTVVRPMSPYGEASFDEATLAVDNPQLIFEASTRVTHGAAAHAVQAEASASTTAPGSAPPTAEGTRRDQLNPASVSASSSATRQGPDYRTNPDTLEAVAGETSRASRPRWIYALAAAIALVLVGSLGAFMWSATRNKSDATTIGNATPVASSSTPSSASATQTSPTTPAGYESAVDASASASAPSIQKSAAPLNAPSTSTIATPPPKPSTSSASTKATSSSTAAPTGIADEMY